MPGGGPRCPVGFLGDKNVSICYSGSWCSGHGSGSSQRGITIRNSVAQLVNVDVSLWVLSHSLTDSCSIL